MTIDATPLPIRAVAVAAAAAAMLLAVAACSKRPPADPHPATSTASLGTDVTPDNVPPSLVGVWTSTRGTTMRCIELHADGVYLMVPNAEAGDHFNDHGTWRVGGGQITWRDASQNWRPDVNPMVDVSDGHFTTIEVDKSETRFERIADAASSCPRS